MAGKVPHVLLIGPLPPPIGGTRVSFRHLVDFLRTRSEITFSLVELRPMRRHPLRSMLLAATLLARIARALPKADLVSLHCNPTALFALGIAVALLARLAGKPLIVRTFGGASFLSEYRGIRLSLVRWALRSAALYLAQTQSQVTMARTCGIEHVRWFPTSRPTPDSTYTPAKRTSCKRFVFCGHVKASKGILELITAAELLGDDIVVDVYGPFRDGMTEAVFEGCRVVRYCGALEPERVMPTLRQYDALVLPTYFEGEGHPGIIVEGYQAGLPVIATRWRAIPELVDDCSGLLVESRSAEELAAAMRLIAGDNNLFRALAEGAAKIGARYSLAFWSSRFLAFCMAAVEGRVPPNDPDWSDLTA